jgi:hypothetical protein
MTLWVSDEVFAQSENIREEETQDPSPEVAPEEDQKEIRRNNKEMLKKICYALE